MPCTVCGKLTERHFFIGDGPAQNYRKSICTQHRWEYTGDVNKLYVKKAFSLFTKLWTQAKKDMKLKIPKENDLKKYVYKNKLTFPVPCYKGNWYCLPTIEYTLMRDFNEIKAFLNDKDPGFDPKTTWKKCLNHALYKKTLRSVYLGKKRKNPSYHITEWSQWHRVVDDFPFQVKRKRTIKEEECVENDATAYEGPGTTAPAGEEATPIKNEVS